MYLHHSLLDGSDYKSSRPGLNLSGGIHHRAKFTMLLSTSFSLLALSLLTGTEARALAKKSIKWSQCEELNKNISTLTEALGPFTSFECGTLPVPLDYTDDNSPPLDLDLFRVKATKEPVLGTVLFNPGGPGGAAGDNFPPAAADLRNIVGEQYHLVSWDPRGTGRTIPFNGTGLLNIYAGSSPQKRDFSLATVNTTDLWLTSGWDVAGQMAESVVSDNEETGSLIGTVFVARDMLEMVDALCEDGMLRFYGWSYGTVLGSYFATMFPDRVERMVLDANLDPADYRDGHWGDSLHDADKTFTAFLEACIENKEECALAEFLQVNSTQDLFDGINLLIEPLAANVTDVTTLVTLIEAKGLILSQLYWPSQWPALAQTLAAVMNATSEDASTESDSASTEETTWIYDQAVYSIFGIRGSDATWKPTSAEELLPQIEYQANLSGFSDTWYFNIDVSSRWKLPAKERFSGNFTAQTKHPILYVNSEYDPVTPLVAAQRASKGFEGSAVLPHSGWGHGLIASPSTCAHKYTQAYFKDGTLPEEDAYCEPDLKPWELAKARNGLMYGPIPSS